MKLRLSSLKVTLRVVYSTRPQDDQGSNHSCIECLSLLYNITGLELVWTAKPKRNAPKAPKKNLRVMLLVN